jgi:hypothetical protein
MEPWQFYGTLAVSMETEPFQPLKGSPDSLCYQHAGEEKNTEKPALGALPFAVPLG